ncbi:hypothetical protein L3X38_042102 [Prunus dulcis]|uniref:Retrotransposon gag domain-containing protein n=1 Tax=Prunus dulcis TaxID=3755 RepID=A0AAD4UV98_PRUDU|nr:hypothetical protein L3X38_042102 [Prunus dulcis]
MPFRQLPDQPEKAISRKEVPSETLTERHKDTTFAAQQAHSYQNPSATTALLLIPPFASSFRKSIKSRKNITIFGHQPGESHTFESALGYKRLIDEGQCLLFPSTLAGAALNWFYRLEPGTVDSFDQLKQIFLNHFMIQTDRLYSADDFYTIQQGDNDPLWEYAAKFSHEYSRCPKTEDRAAFGAFKSGLRASQFRYLFHSSNWTTYGELMKQATIHANAEHFNFKGMPSAPPCPTANVGQALTPTYDRFPPHQTTNQAPYRTAPNVSAPYTTRDKRRDGF